MSSILMDEITGDPVLDDYNNLIEVDNKTGFEQILDGLFHCDPGSELMNPYYGFDLKNAIRNSHLKDSEMYIETLVIQALNPDNEKLISKIDFVRAIRTGREMEVQLQITSVLNNTITITTGISG